jgi:hypothetical protein
LSTVLRHASGTGTRVRPAIRALGRVDSNTEDRTREKGGARPDNLGHNTQPTKPTASTR